jgi:hypothetical protein
MRPLGISGCCSIQSRAPSNDRHAARHHSDHRHDPDGVTEQALLTAVAQAYPELTPAELSVAIQAGTEQPERQAARRH